MLQVMHTNQAPGSVVIEHQIQTGQTLTFLPVDKVDLTPDLGTRYPVRTSAATCSLAATAFRRTS